MPHVQILVLLKPILHCFANLCFHLFSKPSIYRLNFVCMIFWKQINDGIDISFLHISWKPFSCWNPALSAKITFSWGEVPIPGINVIFTHSWFNWLSIQAEVWKYTSTSWSYWVTCYIIFLDLQQRAEGLDLYCICSLVSIAHTSHPELNEVFFPLT